ncbi:ankyrin repeat-containing domain protein [Aspergillus carlsbadensis]|nr:ankyrin repeat-containing domain protein [Aspergillus carlsbadensis]
MDSETQTQTQFGYTPENRIELPEEMLLEITKCLPRDDLARFLRASKQTLRIGHPVLYTLSVEDSLDTFTWACREKVDSVIACLLPRLLQANKDCPRVGHRALRAAATHGRTEIVEKLVVHEVALDMPEYRLSPLTLAVRNDHADVVRLLIAAGAELDSIDQNGFFEYDVGMLQNATGGRIVHSAVAWKSIKVLKTVLSMDLGIDIDARNTNGQTALCTAAENGSTEVIQALVSMNASPDIACATGFTPLHYAVSGHHLAATEALLVAGADPGVRGPADSYITPPLLTATLNSSAELAGLLLDHGANIEDTYDWRGRTTLSLAVEFGRGTDILDLLLDRGADINTQCVLGRRPIMYAAQCTNVFAAAKLLARGCDLRPDHSGRTPEYFAVNSVMYCGTPQAQELLDLLGEARKRPAGVVCPPKSALP